MPRRPNQIPLDLSPKLKAAVEAEAERRGINRSELIRRAITDYLEASERRQLNLEEKKER